jgi:DNA-binding XRE family transcriptional regulator
MRRIAAESDQGHGNITYNKTILAQVCDIRYNASMTGKQNKRMARRDEPRLNPPALTQFFTAPDGTEMVITTRARWQELTRLAEQAEAADDAGIEEAMMIPKDVADYVRAGLNPVAAWRKVSGMTQATLAQRARVTQAAIARIEASPAGAGRDETLRAIAKALGAPLAHINPPARTAIERMRKAIAQSGDPRTGRIMRPALKQN